MTTCNCCEEGFKNLEQIDPEYIEYAERAPDFQTAIGEWMDKNFLHDVCICDCCGDGDGWYGTPGQHYGPEDPIGDNGPYAYNGGLCECH